MIDEKTLYIIVILLLCVMDGVLTWRIYRLERRMMETMRHFVAAKDFLGGIKDMLGKYRGVAETIAKSGLHIKGHNEKLGEFEFDLKPSKK